MKDRFGAYPRGLWPSEGSVSDEVAQLVAATGFRWMATDEGILQKSGVDLGWDNRRRLYGPYERAGLRLFFRERGLSDAIGFHDIQVAGGDGAHDRDPTV